MTQIVYPRHAIDDAIQDNFEAVKRVLNGDLRDDNLAEDAAISGEKIDWSTVPPDAGIGGVDIGAIVGYAGSVIPDGWLLADGSIQVRLDYPGLFDVIGTVYNTGGETSLQFRLPDLKNRFIYGATSPAGNGGLGGEVNHTLTTPEMPTHSHGGKVVLDGAHDHGLPDQSPNPPIGVYVDNGFVTGLKFGTAATAPFERNWATHTGHQHNINPEGGGGGHNNMPPYILMAYIIRATGGGSGGSGGGGTGGGDKNYVHSQAALSSVWNIAHGLGKHPSVDVVDTGDSVILPDIHYVDDNNVQLLFAAATSGKAYCN